MFVFFHSSLPPTVEKLSLRNCKDITGKGLSYLVQYKKLHTLSLGGLPKIRCNDLAQIQDFPSLRKVKICWCDEITLDSEDQLKMYVRSFLERGGRIRILWDDVEDVDDSKVSIFFFILVFLIFFLRFQWYELCYLNGDVFVV